jgi:hypothetical protein
MYTDCEQIWLPRAEAPETREHQRISSEKLMARVIWNRDRLYVIEALPKGQDFDVGHYCSSVLTRPSKMARQFRNEKRRTLILHADDAHPHTANSSIECCAKLDLRVTPNPPYSPA